MFEQLKKKRRAGGMSVKAITAWFLFGAIIVVFIFFDMSGRNNSSMVGGGGGAAQVNATIISQADVAEAAENLKRNPFYGQFAEMGRNILQAQALNELINLELITQEAKKQGLLVTDAQIRDSIVNETYFQEEGRFKRDRYMGYLAAVHKTAGEFETQQRRELMRQRAYRMLDLALKPTSLETEIQARVQEMKANVEFVSIPAEAAVSPTSLAPAEVATFLKTEGVEKRITDYFEANKATEFSSPEEVNARHILIKAEKGNAEAEAKAKAKIAEIQNRLKTEDFAKVATETSEDTGSKSKGGELGFFGRGRMVPEFETAAFQLKPDQVSEPVQTQYGYHLIKVLAKHEAKTKTLDEVRDGIARKLLASERSAKALDELRELLKKGDVGVVSQWLQKNGFKWDETGAFTIESEQVPKIGESSEVVDAAFGLSAAKPLADHLIRQGANVYVLKFKALPNAKSESAKNEIGPKPDMMREYVGRQRVGDAFRRWQTMLREGARVSVSDEFQPYLQK